MMRVRMIWFMVILGVLFVAGWTHATPVIVMQTQLYKQWDSRWGNIDIDPTSGVALIKDYGCIITSMSMAAYGAGRRGRTCNRWL